MSLLVVCLLQLLGLASSVALLHTLEAVGQPELVVPVWAAAHGVHVVLRYVALRALRFPYPNQVGAESSGAACNSARTCGWWVLTRMSGSLVCS